MMRKYERRGERERGKERWWLWECVRIKAKDTYIGAKETYIRAKETHIRAKETYRGERDKMWLWECGGVGGVRKGVRDRERQKGERDRERQK